MANIAISALPVATSQAGADVLPIVQATTSTTKQLSVTNLFTSPTFVTPALGTVASGVISACTSTSMALTTPVIGAATGTSLSTRQPLSSAALANTVTQRVLVGRLPKPPAKHHGVTLSKSTGQITLNAALASDTTVSFTVTNTVIELATF
jgi:hypothetical protein